MATDLGELRARLTLEAQQFKQSMQQTRTELLNITNSTNATNTSMNNLQSATVAMRDAAESGIVPATELASDLEEQLGNVNDISGETVNSVTDLGIAVEELGPVAEESVSNTTASIEEMLSTIQTASAAIGGIIAAGLGLSVKTAADFEQQMSRVKAISGATEEEFTKLKDSALDLGASTSKSASEVALAFEDMAAMGFNANDIMAAMPGVIAAAEASGSDLASTADIMAAALNSFQMEASEASRVADILAMTANISAASVEDMGYAFKYAAPVANALGMGIEEVSAAIGIMTNAGLEGSQAGTSLRAALLALQNPADTQRKMMANLGIAMKDQEGNAYSLSETIQALIKGTEHMTSTERVATLAKLVGTEAVSGMIAVMEGGVDQLDEFTKALKNSGGASKEAADIMMNNLNGAYEEFTGALETLGIKVGNEFLPMLTDIAREGANVVEAISEMDMSAVKANITFAGTTAALAFLISSVGKLAMSIKSLMFSMGPAGWLIAGVSLLGGAIASSLVYHKDLEKITLDNVLAMREQHKALEDNIIEYDRLKAHSKLTADEMARFVDINSMLQKTSDPTIIARLREEQEKLREKSSLSNDQMTRLIDLNGQIIEVVPESNTVLTDQGNILLENTDKAKKFNNEQIEMIRLELEAEKAKAEANMADYLKEEERLIKSINKEKEKMSQLDKDEYDQRTKISDLQRELAAAKANEDTLEQGRINQTIEREEHKLEAIKKQRAEAAELIVEKSTELKEIQKQIGALDEVKRQMIDIELKQVNINAKRGEELQTIEVEISKLKTKKSELEKTTPLNERNTEEYRKSASAIQTQITNLENVKLKIDELIGVSATLNSSLGKAIFKDIVIQEKSYKQVVNTTGGSGRIPKELHHTGGIVGRGQMPNLHVGGLVSQFMNAPKHNEIDVRLLRNEMVLTEAQQANLMRMIDAGMSGGNNNQGITDPEVINLLRQIESAISQGMNPVMVLDGREVARGTYPYINEMKEADTRRKLRARGE
ncbi:phage tail tape measure protein [Cytobacillus sp. FJAT-53684]|uniref:Phage tail tape measure protein n=1 Tax=Cytobacillus mangrovibacter TaxID=3299024 RepID=A0ABW6K1E4_9BACI